MSHEQYVSNEEPAKETDQPKFQFMRTKGVQPSHRHTASREASTYCIPVSVTLAEGDGVHPPQQHSWNEAIIFDIAQQWLQSKITEV